ncbi:hypothetical protein Q3A66_14240 [Hymenobacter sp. BT770]|uniref:hypothetical protein n=1 Tax=Hymenobacter sp. BT770 TaxID=2886942 RepID=UPI001D1198B1|nr:hypothetical protein [Hymenobacter sp. BT770]MCC3154082.1 hypothetical protein [Hymenobacter sp. BT770]MDO3416226.1 hypothetical protein [Hymenobacter sp. BT770]
MKLRAPLSLAVVLVLFLLLVQVRLWAPYFETHNVTAVLTWDAMGHYLYLPAQFIYHDLSRLAFIPDIMREYQPTGSFYQAFPAPDGPAGAMVMKYPIGVAILNTPFFWLGHWAAGHWHYAQDGFSAPYQIAIAFGSLLYSLLALGLLRRVLLRYVSDVVAAITLGLIVLGTNYLQYSAIDGAMAHNYGFTLYALLLWLTVRWHERPQRWLAAAIGLTLGLLVIVRPSDLVAGLLPVLWGVTSVAAARQKLALLRGRWGDVALLLGFGLLGVLPQLLYWKWASGHFFVYSYEEQGFSFLKPHTWQVLFSFRKGWLIYTPLMALALLGLAVLWRRNRAVGMPVLVYFLVNLWVVSAWDIWWYGGSFGQRALVQSYAALALPLAYLLAWLGEPQPGRASLRGAALIACVLLVNLNLVQHWQYMNGIMDGENMNRHYYAAIFDTPRPTQDQLNLFDTKHRLPGGIEAYTRRELARLTLDDQPVATETGITADAGYNSRQSYRTDPARPYSPTINVRLRDAQLHAGQWVRGSVMVNSEYGAWGQKLVVSLERQGKTVQWENARLQNALSISHRWTPVWLDVPLPPDAQPDDVLKVFVLNENGSPCYLDDIRAEALSPKDGW